MLPAAPSSGYTPVDPSAIALTPRSRALLAASASAPPFASTPLAAQRAARESAALQAGRGATPVREVFDVPASEAGVPLRVYEPPGSAGAPSPLLLFLHGGGWALGSVRTHDELCRQLCAASRCGVVSVDYRLSPEAPYPLPLDDCAAGYSWAAARAGGAGVVLCGDSAGGNLAAALALRLRDEGAAPAPLAQVLVYPAVDAACAAASYSRFSGGFALTLEKMRFYWGLYAGGADAGSPYVSPLLAPSLAGLPPALVVLADADVLRDEGAAYAAALARAGGRADVLVFEGVLHGFIADAENEVAADAVRAIAEWLRGAGIVKG
jgi:acetyl esterase